MVVEEKDSMIENTIKLFDILFLKKILFKKKEDDYLITFLFFYTLKENKESFNKTLLFDFLYKKTKYTHILKTHPVTPPPTPTLTI